MFSEALVVPVVFYVLWTFVDLFRYYRKAKSMGIPLIVIPIDILNLPWQVINPHFWALVDFLHLPLPESIQYMRRDWKFMKDDNIRIQKGPIYAFVTPRRIFIQLCDPDAIHHMFTHRHDFPRPAENYEMLRIYGPSIATASPENWARHRKVLATAFQNEKIMQSVWEESLSQTRQMMELWNEGADKVGEDTRTVSLNVLAAIAFRQSYQFRNAMKASGSDGRYWYRDALKIILDNIILVILIPRKYLQYSWLPAKLRRIGKAGVDFGLHMQQQIDTELAKTTHGDRGNGSLITSFANGIDVHQKDPSKGISVDELLGNLFVINFAGHDTTANTLAFAVLLLVANPEVQDWVGEEITRETQGLSQDQLDYHSLYPKLVRCRAVMNETLRLCPPIMLLPKCTIDETKNLEVQGRQITIPPKVIIYADTYAVQRHPKLWPDEPREWKPSRWVSKERSQSDSETLVTPARGAYFPWSDGPQNCPGLKFSQVEFVAIVLCLLRHHRVDAVREKTESESEVRKRVMAVVDDCDLTILLKMNSPEQVRVRLRRVGEE